MVFPRGRYKTIFSNTIDDLYGGIGAFFWEKYNIKMDNPTFLRFLDGRNPLMYIEDVGKLDVPDTAPVVGNRRYILHIEPNPALIRDNWEKVENHDELRDRIENEIAQLIEKFYDSELRNFDTSKILAGIIEIMLITSEVYLVNVWNYDLRNEMRLNAFVEELIK